MRIGIFGGSFDPVHVGHEAFVKRVRVELNLDQLFVVPVFVSPFKVDMPPRVSGKHRVAMLREAFSDEAWVQVRSDEVERGEVSYTVDTLRRLIQKFPNDQFILLLTEEARPTFPLWKESKEIEGLAKVIFMGPRTSVSSTEIRERLERGLDCKKFLSTKVLDYIEKHRLYSP